MKATAVVYVDPRGLEHDALVRAVNGMNPGYIDLAYVDVEAPESDNMKTVFAVPHMDDDSQKETNPALPTIHLNVWKGHYESHTAPASDHPMFDHPFADKEKDEFGTVVEPARPEYEAQVAAHQESIEGLPSAADLDSAANAAPTPELVSRVTVEPPSDVAPEEQKAAEEGSTDAAD